MTTDCSAPANSAQEQNVWCEKKPTRSILDLQVTLTPVSVRVYMSTIRTREHRFEASKEGGMWKLNIRAKWKFAKYVKAAQNVWIMSSDGQIKYRVVRLHEWCTGRTRKSSNTIQPMKICMKERLKIPATKCKRIRSFFSAKHLLIILILYTVYINCPKGLKSKWLPLQKSKNLFHRLSDTSCVKSSDWPF